MNILKIIYEEVFRNIYLTNLENVFQRNLRTGKARECIFRASGGTNFENLPVRRRPWRCLLGFDVYTGLPKKAVDTSMIFVTLDLWQQYIVIIKGGIWWCIKHKDNLNPFVPGVWADCNYWLGWNAIVGRGVLTLLILPIYPPFFKFFPTAPPYTHKHTHKDTQHTPALGASRLTQPYKYIYLHLLLCAHSSYLYYIEWTIHWYQKFTFHNVFSF